MSYTKRIKVTDSMFWTNEEYQIVEVLEKYIKFQLIEFETNIHAYMKKDDFGWYISDMWNVDRYPFESDSDYEKSEKIEDYIRIYEEEIKKELIRKISLKQLLTKEGV